SALANATLRIPNALRHSNFFPQYFFGGGYALPNLQQTPMKNTHFLFFLLTTTLLLWQNYGCKTTDLNPAYLRIDSVTLETQAQQGSSHHAINTIWVYADDTPIGVFELPTVIPILELGSTSIKILAGIQQNGILSQRITYPFYTAFEQTIDLQGGQVYNLQPIFTYTPSTEFVFINDFELGNNIADIDDNGNQEFVVSDTPADVFEGARAGKVSLSTVQPQFSAATTNFFPNPPPSYPVFMEMSYRADIPFQVWLRGINAEGESIEHPLIRYISQQKTWHKIYLDFTNDVAELDAQGYGFHQFIWQATLPADTTIANFYFDNIKLLNR
ncbi:MAG TPA: hypothetical protein PKH93_01690, partial [Chitinophagales bacterium]|nr:hypothetical protein [Chitinophagales bacterium]